MATITSANSVLTLAILNLFPVPQTMQGYSADTAFAAEAITPVETVMGVDGILSAGWIPVELKMTISIMPDSPSAAMFDAWYAAQQAARETYIANGGLILPSISREFTLIRGFLSTYTAFPEARKVLQARTFGITWGSIIAVPI